MTTTTESKKLLTVPNTPPHGLLYFEEPGDLVHDARIAHEQREVIRKQDAALRAALEPLDLYHAYGWPDRAGVRAKLKAEIDDAAPFLD